MQNRMDQQLKIDTEQILKFAQIEKRAFDIQSYKDRFNKLYPSAVFEHNNVSFALKYLVDDGYLQERSSTYSILPKGVKFENWHLYELEEKRIEAEKIAEISHKQLEHEKNKADLDYVRKLNKDYKKNQNIVIGSAILALLSAIAAIVSAV